MDDVLLTKHLLNETSREESQRVRHWISAHPDNKRHYTRLQLIWEASNSVGPENGIDEQEAWERFTARLDNAGTAAPRPAKTLIRRMGWVRIAAVLVIASFTAFAGYYFFSVRVTGDRLMGAMHETTNLVDTDTLADGSVITLSKFASLRFSQGIFQQKRTVELHKGSVFFEVAHNRNKPFVIQSGKVTVMVLGTSFHVSRNGDETTVIVESGKVKVTGLDKVVELEARQKVTINTTTRQFEERTVIGVLDHTPLWRIAEMLEDAYGVEVTIGNEAIRDLPMTTTLYQGALDQTLRVITETLGVTAIKEGNHIVFN